MNKHYFEIEIESNSEIGENFISFINDFSPLGIWVVDDKKIKVYFSNDPSEFAKQIKKRKKEIKIFCKKMEDKNWVKEYQKRLKPIKVGKKFIIVHFPEKVKAKEISNLGRKIIKLVPGLAFGTGEHFTTASCIEILEALKPFPKSVLDVGTGTGILSIVSAMLGGRDVFAFDIDFDACKVAKETIELNGAKIFLSCSSINSFKNKFDLIIANILYETIVEISEMITELTAQKGKLLLSGIRREKEEKIAELFESKGFFLQEALRDENWSTLLFVRKTKR
ncbi:MAG: 50S ribosomal protein L11 methyltransferase [Acidobacteria bacterium]|nr:50S ribosomal protein L11 methyltransferase [Acidobacteriota bacterium]